MQLTWYVSKSPAGTWLTRVSITPHSQRIGVVISRPSVSRRVVRVSSNETVFPTASGHSAPGLPSSVLVTADHDQGVLRFRLAGVNGLEIVHTAYRTGQIGPAVLDELAKLIVGEVSSFL